MSDTPAATELLRALATVLGTLGARWYVFGAQAVLVWGRPRLTGDVDVTIFLDPEQRDLFVAAIASSPSRMRRVDSRSTWCSVVRGSKRRSSGPRALSMSAG